MEIIKNQKTSCFRQPLISVSRETGCFWFLSEPFSLPTHERDVNMPQNYIFFHFLPRHKMFFPRYEQLTTSIVFIIMPAIRCFIPILLKNLDWRIFGNDVLQNLLHNCEPETVHNRILHQGKEEHVLWRKGEKITYDGLALLMPAPVLCGQQRKTLRYRSTYGVEKMRWQCWKLAVKQIDASCLQSALTHLALAWRTFFSRSARLGSTSSIPFANNIEYHTMVMIISAAALGVYMQFNNA